LITALVDLGAHDYTAFYHQRGEAHLVAPIDTLPRLTTSLDVRPWRLRTAIAYFSGVGMDAMFPGIDVFHATEHLLPRLRRVRSVFTLHDLIFQFDPGSHKPLNIAFLRMMIPRFLRAADAVICVSECSKRDAVRFYDVPSDKICVIYEGVDPRFKPVYDPALLETLRRKYALPDRFILHLGTIEPRKNLPLLFETLPSLLIDNCPLIIAGKTGWLTGPIFDRLKELGVQDRVRFTGFVPDDDLPTLISAASVLVMPSKYEGFGLPVLEAMACGTPVIISNRGSLPEIAGQAALVVDPDDAAELGSALARVWRDPGLRAALRHKGLARAAEFSWERCARETLVVYKRVLREA
jgi:glycosyltransferase involved in cell wall biosynthesis